MKKILFALVAGSLSALVATNGAYAQNSVNTEVIEPQKTFTAADKTATSNDGTTANSAISQKAIKNFATTYKNVSGESWEKNSEGFTARFSLDGVRNLVYYGNNGQWLGSLKGYSEEKMPSDIRKIVKREYYDFSITYVQEAENTDSDGKPTYIVHLEDKDEIKLVRICDGNMDIWKEYKKQP